MDMSSTNIKYETSKSCEKHLIASLSHTLSFMLDIHKRNIRICLLTFYLLDLTNQALNSNALKQQLWMIETQLKGFMHCANKKRTKYLDISYYH